MAWPLRQLTAAALLLLLAPVAPQMYFPDEDPVVPMARSRSRSSYGRDRSYGYSRNYNRPSASKVHRRSKVNVGGYNPQTPRSKYRGGCNEMPPTPANSVIKCSTVSGCRVTCMAGHAFPNGASMIRVRCSNGRWTPPEPLSEIPSCQPTCSVTCQNGGTCVSVDTCKCPEGFQGDHCEIRRPRCTAPRPRIMNAQFTCTETSCSITCMRGYETADQRTSFELACTEDLGWVPAGNPQAEIPACEPVCRPQCQNGGKCIAFNLCQCPSTFRGPHCQWDAENCNPATQLQFNGAYNCSGRGDQYGCTLTCPEGVQFSSPPADIYQCDYATGEYSPQPIPQCAHEYEVIAPTEAIFNIPSVAPEPAVCQIWSAKHVRTFDNLVYSFKGGCAFTAVRDTASSMFRISVLRSCDSPDCDFNVQFADLVTRTLLTFGVTYNGESKVTKSSIGSKADLEELTLPAEVGGITIEDQGGEIVASSSEHGIQLRFRQDYLAIESEPSNWASLSGLCGNSDGNANNDYLPYGGITNMLREHSSSETCSSEIRRLTPGSCRPEQRREMRERCEDLLGTEPFDHCHEHGWAEAFLTACVSADCATADLSSLLDVYSNSGGASSSARAFEENLCTVAAAYAAVCEWKTGQAVSWRAADRCPLPCPEGQIFSQCGAGPSDRCGSSVSDAWVCQQGCSCREGFLLDRDQCVEPQQCSCMHNGQRYAAGDKIEQGCNTCACSEGQWVCTDRLCASQCVVAGDPHYQTFDGVRFDFQGKCSYYLVQANDYDVMAENVPCSGAISEKMNFHPASIPSEPSCTRSVQVKYKEVTVELKQNLVVLVNDQNPPIIPWWQDGVYIKYASSSHISVTLPNGVEVWWDGETRAVVHAPAGLTDAIGGLCGNNNNNQADDFTTPEGDVETSVIDFASKWKVSETCDDATLETIHPCRSYPEKFPEATSHCDVLKSDIFKECHSLVDPAPFVQNCRYDVCSCRVDLADCYCVHLADYAAACALSGVHVGWRSEVGVCGVSCPYGQEYKVCGDSCAHSCFDLATNTDCQKRCVEGCQCPEGMTLDNEGRCTPVSACPCVFNNKEYQAGHKRYTGSGPSRQQCECVNAQWSCENVKTERIELPSVQCSADDHKEYAECLPPHPRTCKNRNKQFPESAKSQRFACESGCVCQDGYVLDAGSGECVRPEQCPCHHGGKAYAQGETLTTECRSCTCDAGFWACEDQDCDGVCSAWGNSHYQTFDGRIYDIEGDCQYMLAKGKYNFTHQFEIVVTNVRCGSGSTCPKAVSIRVGPPNSPDTVLLEHGKPLPSASETKKLAIRQAGAFAFVEASSLGLVVQWDYGTRIYIRLASTWKGKTVGLCGNFDGNPGDDFRGPSGLLESTAVQFAEQYKLKPYCPDTSETEDYCALAPERHVYALKKCAVLESELFSDCHGLVRVEPFVERCTADTCACASGGDCECLCTALAAYGQACSLRGVHIRWRSNDLCPMQCDAKCSEYSPCVSACPPKTCENRLVYDRTTKLCADDSCVEGCLPHPCEPGEVYNNASLTACQPEKDCRTPCAEKNGTLYYEGDVVSKDSCHVCYCTRGAVKCMGSACPLPDPELPPTAAPPTGENLLRSKLEVCREGWSSWVNRNKPMPISRPNDVERIPSFIEPTNEIDALFMVADLEPDSSAGARGRVIFHQKARDQPLTIAGNVTGLPAGLHGFHIHAGGRTWDQCRDAGGSSTSEQTSDLGNIIADLNGDAQIEITVPLEKASLFGEDRIGGMALVQRAAGQAGYSGGLRAGEGAACAALTRAYENTGPAFCADNQVTDIQCRTAVTNLPITSTGDRVSCTREHGLVCRSDYTCQDYKIKVLCDCSIEPTEEPPTVAPPPTKPPSACTENDWTPWMNSHRPGPGDWTDVEDIRSLRTQYSFCGDQYLTAIECRTVESRKDVSSVGGGAICDLNQGLVCSDALGYCADFEVRLFCNCEEPPPTTEAPEQACLRPMSPHETDCHKFYQCVPGQGQAKVEKTCGPFMMFNPRTSSCDYPSNVIAVRRECDPKVVTTAQPSTEATTQQTTTTTEGDATHCDEINPLRAHEDCHKYYQCVRTGNDQLDEFVRSCGNYMMFNPRTLTCDSISNVLAIKPECGDVETTTVQPTDPTTEKLCPFGQVYDDCLIQCDQLCHYFEGFLVAQGFCKVRDACKPGCRDADLSYQGCPSGYVWKDEDQCVRITDCNCRLPNGAPLGPGAYITEQDSCTRTQCINNELVSDSSDCVSTAKPIATVDATPSTASTAASPRTIPTTTAPATPLPEGCNEWEDWIDSNNINSGDYEVEMHSYWQRLDYCPMGIARVECEEVGTGRKYWETNDVGVTCTVIGGVTCRHSAQPGGRCHNYKVRYYCDCEATTTVATTTTRPTTPETAAPTETPYPTATTSATEPTAGPLVSDPTEGTVAPTTTPITSSTVLPPPACNEALFVPLIDGESLLPTSQISSSSDASAATRAVYARVSAAERAWSPSVQDEEQYLQVDLGAVTPVYGVSVIGSKTLQQAVTQFNVLYSVDGNAYSYAVDRMGQPANLYAEDPLGNGGTVVLPVPVEGRYIRINPTNWRRRITMQLELYGCDRRVVSPRTPPPETTSTAVPTTTAAPTTTTTTVRSTTTPVPRCMEPMGLESGQLHSSLVEVSSQLSNAFGPDGVRPGSSGWIPKNSNDKQYIRIDFTDERKLDAVTTTGIFIPADASRYQPEELRYIGSYRLRYSSDGVHWSWVYNNQGHIKVFPGHTERTALSAMRNVFDAPIEAQHLELVPTTWADDGIGTTLEVHGCYEPYPEVTTTTTTSTTSRPCTLCAGIPADYQEGCESCRGGEWWDGDRCLDGPALCPCYHDGAPHAVGSIFDTADCEECVCQIGGVEKCKPKTCPPCGGDLIFHLGDDCSCSCVPCAEGSRICRTSRVCLQDEKWCDGIKHCPDDEGEECIETTTTPEPTTPEPTTTEPPPTASTTPPPILPQYCVLKGNTFNTFDDVEYKYQICHHTLVREEGLWEVSVHKVCNGTECHREVRVELLDETVTLIPGVGVKYGDYTYTMQQAKAIRSKQDTFIVSAATPTTILLKSDDVGFAVLVNSVGNVVVGVTKDHFGTVEGLCGDYDGNKYNDKSTPVGEVAGSTMEFGDSWAKLDEPQTCEPDTCEHAPEAFTICQKIRLSPFSGCHATVRPDSFISSCLETACACLDEGKKSEECRCNLLTNYVTECLSQDPTVDLSSWRVKHDCPVECPEGEVYRDCYRPTCEPSCSQLEACSTLPNLCFQGCYCPDGQVRSDDGKCVSPLECRDCECTSYPGGQFETFDKHERILDTNCTYLAAGSADGAYDFKVLVDKGNCESSYSQRVECYDTVMVRWLDNTVTLKRSGTLVEVFVNGAMVEGFHHKYDWGSVSQPPQGSVLVSVKSLHLDVGWHPNSGALSIRMPSKLHSGGVNGVCGNCDMSYLDEAAEPPSVWLEDVDDPADCLKEDIVCVPPPPELDPCQKMLDDAVFGACQLLEDPQPFINACQRRFCDDGTHDVCDDLALYAATCFQRGICVQWRSEEMCGRGGTEQCPPTMEYRQCTGTCLKSCDKRDCPLLEQDGCFCPDGHVFEDGVCRNESICRFCDDDRHRVGDSWKEDNCTSCECRANKQTVCTKAPCPGQELVVCGDNEMIEEIPGTGSECCPPQYRCVMDITTTTAKPAPIIDLCPVMVEPKCEESKGKKGEIIYINECPVATCVCIPDFDCEVPDIRGLRPGESVLEKNETCCMTREIVCNTSACPAPPECPDGFLEETKAGTEEHCCPVQYCKQPEGTCLVRLDVAIDIRTITKEDTEGFVLKRAGEVWTDGYCDNCTCREVPDGEPRYQPICHQVSCPTPSAADLAEYKYEESDEDYDDCCSKQTRVACKHDGKIYRPGEQTWSPVLEDGSVDPCVTWECQSHMEHGVIKVSNRETCQTCDPGYTYIPAPAGSGQCCGRCERTACIHNGVEYEEGEAWKSEDTCIDYYCERDFFDSTLGVLSSSVLCRDVSDCPRENLYTDETGCCQRCNRTDNCHVKVVPPAETVAMFKSGECVNTEQVTGLIRCQGACDSMAFFDTDSASIQAGCKCCSVTETKEIEVPLTCTHSNYNTTEIQVFVVPDGCKCSKCGSSSSELEQSETASKFWQQSTGGDWVQQQSGLPDFPDFGYADGSNGFAGGSNGYADGNNGYAGGNNGFAGGNNGFAGGHQGFGGGAQGFAGGLNPFQSGGGAFDSEAEVLGHDALHGGTRPRSAHSDSDFFDLLQDGRPHQGGIGTGEIH